MKILTDVHDSDEYSGSDIHCAYIEITPDYARTLLNYIELASSVNNKATEMGSLFLDMRILDDSVRWIDRGEENTNNSLEETLSGLGLSDKNEKLLMDGGYAILPNGYILPKNVTIARTEMDTVIVDSSSITYKTMPKYRDNHVGTTFIATKEMLEKIAAKSTRGNKNDV